MANEQNLRPKPFTSENQPSGEKKSRKGIPNRATVFKKWLTTKIEVDDPTATDKSAPKIKVSLLEAAALGQIQSAMKGNTNAWKEIQDTLHGKMPDKVENSGEINVNHSGEVAFKQAAEKIYDGLGSDNKG